VRPELLRSRATVLRALRQWFDAHGYLEIHTPLLVPSPALEEHLEAVKVGDRFLHTSPEFAMKRVLAAGLPRIYQIGPCFREEEAGVHHAREFTMLEWYRAGAGTAELMDEVEALIGTAAEALGQAPPLFTRRAIDSLIKDEGDPDAWFHTWVDRVEPTLTAPTIVHGYPPWQAALARIRDGRADRFEVYLGGIELGNAFAELLDAQELRDRWQASSAARAKAGRPPHPVDEAFLDAVARMPRCAGIAIGIDRLIMALTGAAHIADVQVG
jgi:lysyl-tRNA synthetase class 2